MISRSGFFDPRGARRAQGVPPRLQWHDATGTFTYAVGVQDPNTGKYVAKHTPVAFGTKFAIDFGAGQRGWFSYRPFDDGFLMPMHESVDHRPEASPGEGYTLVVRVPVMLATFGLALMTLGGVLAQGALFDVYLQYWHAAEAVAGKIPVVVIRPSRQEPIRSRNNELHMVPVLEITGWIERDSRYGTRRVPVPTAVLKGAPNGPPLSAPTAAAAATPVPANDLVAPQAVPANDDPFAGMTPATAPLPF
jgi:hypothetical protein